MKRPTAPGTDPSHPASNSTAAARTLIVAALLLAPSLYAAEDTPKRSDVLEEVITVEDRLEVLPTTPVESVFGFGKSVLETPRAVTTISSEMMNRVIITEIEDLVALTPGSFTQSFFGVAGSLDVRGTPGENYFRGIKRIDNPGNYPQAIGASDRIDVVRGPASPIYGPSKIGGYLNFVPKSARASSGQYFSQPQGEFGLSSGTFDRKVIHAEIGGPAEVAGKTLGYYLYGEFENSDSYYQNTQTDQSIYQVSFDLKLSDVSRLEFGGMYQDFQGNQVAGFNRLTQDLIDNGTYITGSPASLDTDGDGLLSPADLTAAGANLAAFVFGPSVQTPADIVALLNPEMALLNPGTARISGSTVLAQEDDTLEDQVLTLYFDWFYEPGSEGFKFTNKVFFESLDNLNENAYGFSQFADTWVFEDQAVFAYEKDFSSDFTGAFQLSPSIRHQDFEHGDDFDFEFFDRRDLTGGGSPIDRRALATRGQSLFSNHNKGKFTDYGLAFLTDLTFFDKLNVLAGARYDYIDVESEAQPDAITTPGLKASDEESATSWTASLSYQLPFGIRPYVTFAEQSTLIIGQGGQIDVGNVASGNAVADSELEEFGIKASLLDGRLYAAIDRFRQKRVDFNAQDTVTNNTTEAEGYEFEARWVATRNLTFTAAYTNLKIFNLSARSAGTQFSFAGAEDLPGVDPALFLGGVVPSIVLVDGKESSRKAGIPENLYSLYAIASFDGRLDGLTASLGASYVDSVFSGFSKTIRLPSYTLVNAGIHYERQRWKVGVQGKNLTDERYFRSNFPDLFGSSVVLPELPRSFLLSAGFKF